MTYRNERIVKKNSPPLKQPLKIKMTRKIRKEQSAPKKSLKRKAKSKINFNKISKFLNNTQADSETAYSGEGEELAGSSKGIRLTELLFERINYNNDFFDCNISGKVSAFVVFNRDGSFNEQRSKVFSNSPFLKVHTVQELRKIHLPDNINSGAKINVIIEYIRNPAAGHSQNFVSRNTFFLQILR